MSAGKHPAGRAGVAPSLDDDLDDLRCQRCGFAVVDEIECCDPDCPYHPADTLSEQAESPPERTSAAQRAPDDAQVQEGAADASDVQDALRTLTQHAAWWALRQLEAR